jgi:glutamate:GABA antiporter
LPAPTERTPAEAAKSDSARRGLPVAAALILWPALAMMIVANTGSVAQLSDSATFGLGAVTVYLLPALLFMVPVALVSAELATSWEGGIFAWVRAAFGDRWGFQGTWLQWIQSVALYPSLLSFAAASLATAFGAPHLASNGLYVGTVVLIVFWLATYIVTRGMGATARAGSIGLIIGTVIPVAALIAFMFVWLGGGKHSDTPLGVSDLVPPVDGISSLALVVGTFVAYAGLEVNAVHIRHLKGRPRTYFLALPIAVLTIFLMYCLGSIAISIVVPDSTLNLDAGAAQAFDAYASGFGLPVLGNLLSAALAVGALAASIVWVAGPSRSLLLVGRAGYLPPRLQRVNKVEVQTPILVVQGLIVTVLALVFVVAPNTSTAFAVLQDMTVVLYMCMYIIMFAAVLRLRRTHPDRDRPFRVPAVGLVAGIGMLAAASAIALGMTPPSQLGNFSTPAFVGIVLAGVLVLAVPPQFIYRWRRSSWAEVTPGVADSELAETDSP